MTKQPFRFTIFLLICLLIPSTAAAQVKISAVPSVDNPAIGDTIAVSINISGASNVVGYEVILTFNPTQLEFISFENSDYLPAGASVTLPTVENGSVKLLAAVLPETGTSEGDGTLAIATFKVLVDTETTVGLGGTILLTIVNSAFTTQPVELIGATINSTGSGEDVTVSEEVVTIPDSNLRAAIEAELGKASGDTITTDEMATLTRLEAPEAGISNLTGLESATNLTGLYLEHNAITDISVLAGLPNLVKLALGYNDITDHSILSGLTNLTFLDLRATNTSDLSVLSGLTKLERLFIDRNGISDLSPLAGLTNLTDLALNDNSISDLSPLRVLTNLKWMRLAENNVTDLSPLVANTGLGSGDTINVKENPLNRASIQTHIPALEGRGVTVEFDFPLEEIETVDIPDSNLRAKITDALGKASDAPITTADMANLTSLEAPNANINNLTGLESATNLTRLLLFENSITDVSALSDLTNLTELGLWFNSITDISPLSGLTSLTWVGLGKNRITDISPLSGLINLTRLTIYDNGITDVSSLSNLTNLTSFLRLDGNNITDISPLSGLINLERLSLHRNTIADISALSGLTNLTYLGLYNNSISDLSPLVANTGLGNGDVVEAWGNPLSDASIQTHIPELQNRGVTVEFIQTPTFLLKISGTVTASDNLLIVEVRDNRDRPLKGAPVTFTVISGGGTLSVTNATTGPNGRAESRLTLGPNIGTNRVRASVEGISEPVTFSDVPEPPVDIPDPNLRAAIEARLGKASGAPITASDMARLTDLSARNANITDLTGLEAATNLTRLDFGADFGAEGPINSNSVSDISPLLGLTNLTSLSLWLNSISDISPVAGLTNLISMNLGGNSISDISPVAGLTNLTSMNLDNNSISDISPVAGLTNLEFLRLDNNSISDISPVAGLTNLTTLWLNGNSISDISVVAGLTNLEFLSLFNNTISDISPVAGLTNLTTLWLDDNSISDISPLVENMGLEDGDFVIVSENPLNYTSIHTHIPALESRGVRVVADDLKPPAPEYTLSIPAGISLIHVPLKVTAVDGVPKIIESISDLYDALGGANTVNYLVTHDPHDLPTQKWRSYLAPSDKGTPADRALTDDMGIIAGMKAPVSLRLSGTALGTGGTSTITLSQGHNLVGIPLRDERINRVSDLLRLDGIWGNVSVITVNDGGAFKVVRQVGDPGDIAITGGSAFILTAQQPATVEISGEPWTNVSETAAAPLVTRKGIEVGTATPVLVLRGSVVEEEGDLKVDGFRVTAKNLSTGRAVTAVRAPDETGYQFTVVDIETGRAAMIGDVLEVSTRSANPQIGVEPFRYTVTAEDVKRSLIQLPDLVAYEIPAETQLLANYPNPFNPETWIPYRLAEDAFVTLTIYDGTGQVVRTIEVGHQTAAVYENRSKAIYWDGRNQVGETVASGVYFYHLSAGDYSATRKMLILK